MGCCASSTSLPAAQIQSKSEVSTGYRSQNGKKSSPKRFSTKIEKNYSNDLQQTTETNRNNNLESPKAAENGWDLDASERAQKHREHQQKMDDKRIQLAEDAKKLKQLQDDAFDQQVSRQRAKTFTGLYSVFQTHATNANKTKMDIDGLTNALAEFGMIISTDRTFQKLVWRKFDMDNENEIDYNDFSATLSTFVGTKDEEVLLLMFQIFDIDQDGYLNTEDMARILLAKNHITVVCAIGQRSGTTSHKKYTKGQCLKLAKRIMTKYDNEKVSIDGFCEMMSSITEEDLLFDHMVQPSMSTININVNGDLSAGSGSENQSRAQTDNLTPQYSPQSPADHETNNLTPQYSAPKKSNYCD